MGSATVCCLVLAMVCIRATAGFQVEEQSNGKRVTMADGVSMSEYWRPWQWKGISDGFHIELDSRTLLTVFLVAIAASLSSAGGVGGGGLFVPIFNLMLGLDMSTSAAFTSFVIVGGMLANLMWSWTQTHPAVEGKSVTDYTVILLMLPNMLLGIGLGVVCNLMFPGWLISLLLTIVLFYVTMRTCRTGLRMWKNESFFVAHELNSDSVEYVNLENEICSNKDSTIEENKGYRFRGPWCELSVLLLIWLAFFAVQVLKGTKNNKSVLNLEPCGVGYWVLTASQVPFAFLITCWMGIYVRRTVQEHISTTEESKQYTLLPLMAIFAGVLGGVLGIGGGMIVNPILLEIGMHPQVTAATTAFMVFFSSSQSVAQFWLIGSIPVNYALCFSALCFSFSMVGLALVQYAVKRLGRPSLIVFVVSSVMGFTAVLMAVFGSLDVWKQYIAGEDMGFRSPC